MNQSRPTIGEVARAVPKRGTGAPPRCTSHKQAILDLLRERGERGLLASELYSQPSKFGRSPRNRVSELRHEGHLIEGAARGSSDWFYRLIREDLQPKRDWYDGVRPMLEPQESRDALPLFAEASR